MSRVYVTTSWDDGYRLDARLAGLLEKHGLQATFYIAPRNRELAVRDRLAPSNGRQLGHAFEVGAHTMTHRSLTELRRDEAFAEIGAGKRLLEHVIGSPVTSFSYPHGRHGGPPGGVT